jgi:hypothetical protein
MRVTQELGAACFDKSECTTCPFNSATQRALFETHVDDGHCTNRECFELKTEAHEKAEREEQERIAAEAKAAAPPDADDADGDDDSIAETSDASASTDETGTPATTASASPTSTSSRAQKAAVTAKSIAGRTRELREESWRTALARALARNAENAQVAILIAAMSGTLSEIKPETLTSRAGLLVGDAFADLDYSTKIAEIRTLPAPRATNILAVIGAAYAKDVLGFAHVADLARAFDVDLRNSWQVDQAFLERFTKDEIRFIAQECGFVAHIGEKAFAKLLGSKKPDIITGMLNRTGFDWAGRLPSAMTLDGKYGPPPADDASAAAAPDIAA